MTDEEITELVLHSAALSSGCCTALLTAFRALQAQPNYDHAAFTTTLAMLQTGMEDFKWPSPAAYEEFSHTLERLGEVPLRQPPWSKVGE